MLNAFVYLLKRIWVAWELECHPGPFSLNYGNLQSIFFFLHWERAWLKFFWIIFKIKLESFHERWSSLVGDMKHNLRGNIKIISINILAYRCLWNNKQRKTKMLILKRKLWEKYKINVYFSHDNSSPKAKQNILIRWRVEWPRKWRHNPQTNLTQYRINTLYLSFPSCHLYSPLNRRKMIRKTSIFLSRPLRAYHQVARSSILFALFFPHWLTFFL